MALRLRLHENVLYPVPYMETEAHPFIITNQRLVQFRKSRACELPTSQISAVNRSSPRPLLSIGLLLILLGLPALVTAGELVYSVWGMNAAPISDLLNLASSWMIESDDTKDERREPAPDQESPEEDGHFASEVLYTRLGSAALAGIGLLLLLGGWRFVRHRRYFILCCGPGGIMRVRAENEHQQTQILLTVQAARD